MRIRNQFVSNSSSCSYTIGVPDFHPELGMTGKVLFLLARIVCVQLNEEEWRDFAKWEYCWDDESIDDARETEMVRKGLSLLHVTVDYHDKYGYEAIKRVKKLPGVEVIDHQ